MAAPLWELAPGWWRGEAVVWWQRDFEEALIPPVGLQSADTQELVRAQLPPT